MDKVRALLAKLYFDDLTVWFAHPTAIEELHPHNAIEQVWISRFSPLFQIVRSPGKTSTNISTSSHVPYNDKYQNQKTLTMIHEDSWRLHENYCMGGDPDCGQILYRVSVDMAKSQGPYPEKVNPT